MYYKPAFILLYKIKLYYIYSYSYMNFFGSIQESTISVSLRIQHVLEM